MPNEEPGGVLGGVVGHQAGGGSGKTALTVLGAIGGGLAGHEVEKRVRSETVYDVHVRMEDGSTRTFRMIGVRQATPAALQVVGFAMPFASTLLTRLREVF